MSIISCKEIQEGNTAEDTESSKTATRTYLVKTDSSSHSGVYIINDANYPAVDLNSLPTMGSPHPEDSQLELISRKPSRMDDSGIHWKVSLKYQIPSGGGGSEGGTTHPTKRTPIVSWGYKQYTKVVEKAYKQFHVEDDVVSLYPEDERDDNGNPSIPVQTTVGNSFSPALTEEFSNMTIRILRNEDEDDFDPNWLADYKDSFNIEDIRVGGIDLQMGQGRMRNAIGTPKWDADGEIYWEVVYDIEVNRETHIRKAINRDFYILKSEEGTEMEKIKQDDKDVVIPMNVNEAGTAVLPKGSAPYILNFQTKFATYWKALRLPKEKDGTSPSRGS